MHVGGVDDHGESAANLGPFLTDPDHVWTRTEPHALMLALERPSASIMLPRVFRAVLLVGALQRMSWSVWPSGVIWINTQPGSTR